MAVAMGLALLTSPPVGAAVLSIVPAPIKKRRTFFRTTFWMLVAGAILVGTLGILAALSALRKGAQEAALSEFQAKTASLSKRLQEMEVLELEQKETSAKVDYLLSFGAAGRGTLDVTSKLRKVLPQQGITIRQMRFTELGERRDSRGTVLQGGERHRAAFMYAGRGLVLGEVESETDGRIKLKGEPVPFEPGLIQGGILRWPVAARSLLVVGDADENIRGGPREVLNAILRELEDKARGVTAKLLRQNPSPDKPGWRVFEILVTFE
jgi:hypothetical protein